MSKRNQSKSGRPWRGDPYWRYELEGILHEFGAKELPDLMLPEEGASKRMHVAYRVRRKYIVRRIAAMKKECVGTMLERKVHDFLDQARHQTTGIFWRELDQVFHSRGVFML